MNNCSIFAISGQDVYNYLIYYLTSLLKFASRRKFKGATKGDIMAKLNLSSVDREAKKTSMQMNVDDAILEATVDALANALDGILLGSAVSADVTTTVNMQAGSQVPPAEFFANRGNKWLIRIESIAGADIGKIYTHEMGTADLNQLPATSSDFLDLTAGVGLAFKNALEAAWESPIGSAGTLLSVQAVERTD